MIKALLHTGRNKADGKETATNKRLSLARILNTCFYFDSRPELRNIEFFYRKGMIKFKMAMLEYDLINCRNFIY